MNRILLILSTLLIFYVNSFAKYDNDIDYIIYDIKNNIMNNDICRENPSSEVDNLIWDVERRINQAGNDTNRHIEELKYSLQILTALKKYIDSVICGQGFIYSHDFLLMNNRFSGEVSSVIKGEYCLDLISVTIGHFKAFLLVNSQKDIHYRFNYSYSRSISSGMYVPGGSGQAAIMANSQRRIFSNRYVEYRQSKIQLNNLKCSEFYFPY